MSLLLVTEGYLNVEGNYFKIGHNFSSPLSTIQNSPFSVGFLFRSHPNMYMNDMSAALMDLFGMLAR